MPSALHETPTSIGLSCKPYGKWGNLVLEDQSRSILISYIGLTTGGSYVLIEKFRDFISLTHRLVFCLHDSSTCLIVLCDASAPATFYEWYLDGLVVPGRLHDAGESKV